MFNRILRSNSGVGLVEVLVAAAIVGGGVLLVMHLAGENKKGVTKFAIEKDIAVTSGEIFSILIDPPSCNANFYGLTTGTGTLPGIYKCGSGNCRLTGSKSLAFPVSTSWNETMNKVGFNARIGSIAYSVNRMNGISFSTLFLDITYAKNLQPQRNYAERFAVQVVVDNDLIIGCPKAWNSTIPY